MAKTDNHNKYYINSYGERVMRVSEVIKILAKDQLITWANMLGFKHIDYKQELERTANIGSLCHDVLESYFSKNRLAVVDYDDFNIESYGDKIEVRNALDSFFRWFKRLRKTRTYNIKFTERVVIGKDLGGTIDCAIDGWDDPRKAIFVDYKTSKSFYLTQFLQLAAYVMLYEEIEGKDTVEGIMVVRLEKRQGKEADAWFIHRKELDPFIMCFQCMYDTARGTNILNHYLRSIVERIG